MCAIYHVAFKNNKKQTKRDRTNLRSNTDAKPLLSQHKISTDQEIK